jgi:serine/threonine-protein kinase
VTIKQTKLATIRAFTIGFSASLLVLACGGDDNNGDEGNLVDEPAAPAPPVETVVPDPVQTAPDVTPPNAVVDEGRIVEDCGDNPLLAGCPGDASAAPDPGGQPLGEREFAQEAAQNILSASCGQCHGSQLTPQGAMAGMNYIDNLDLLIENGKAIPGESETSPIITRMRSGSMPPATSQAPRPSDQDINTVAQFLDNPTFFPGIGDNGNCEGQLMEFDDIYDLMQNDILRQDADDRAFTRYILLTNRYNQGICADGGLDRDRFGMDKLLNMLSIEAQVETATPIDRDETIYRIDIRDYGWDREIDVVGVDVFEDGWEAIVAANQYAVQFEGDEAEQVILQAETDVPWMYADTMVDVASLGNLYYALIDVDVNDSLDDFILDDLQIDVIENLDQEDLIRAGTTRSVISRQDRVAERHDIGVRQGAFWQSFDFDADEANESIFDDPFGFAEGGREAIFTLANGFLGYIIADADDNIVEESDILFDTSQNDFVARTSVSCSGCHAQGFLPMVDEVRAVVERNRFNFNADDFEAVQEVYPTPDEFLEIVNQDSDDFQRSLGRARIPTNIADPMSGSFLEFDRDMDITKVAGDLGVSVELLEGNIALLDPQIQTVRGGNRNGLAPTIDRDDFTALYLQSLCIMQVSSQNQPLVDDCEDVGVIQ